jgi:acyl-CoA thioester hydrolase
MGHVSNNSYSQYFEVARLHWFSAIGIEQPMSVLANVNIDFLGEINLSDKIYVTTECTKKGTKSLQLTHAIYAEGKLVTKSTAVLVGFDPSTRKSCEFLPDWEV